MLAEDFIEGEEEEQEPQEVSMIIPKEFKPIFTWNYRFLIFKGGRSSGKSWGIADSLIAIARNNQLNYVPRILCVREHQSNIKNSSYKLLCDRIKYFGLDDFAITNENIINKITEAEFVFKGLSDTLKTDEGLKSIEGITHCWCEEAHKIGKKSWELLTPSIRGNEQNGKRGQLIISYNPQTENDPVYKYFIDRPKKRSYIIHLNYLQNKYCPQDLLEEAEELKKYKPAKYKNIWLGEMKETGSNAVVKYFSKENIKNVNYCETEPLYWSLDFNVDPAMSVLYHRLTDSKKFCVFDEIVIDNCTSQDVVQEFLSRYGQHRGKIIINGDASGDYRKSQSKYSDYAIIVNALRREGLGVSIEIQRANPSISDRISVFNQCVFGDKGARRLFISPKCKWLLYNMWNLRYKEGTSLLDIPSHSTIAGDGEMKYLGHIFDALGYAIYYYDKFKIEKEKGE
jgi:PBSX family phage terminase large subunit